MIHLPRMTVLSIGPLLALCTSSGILKAELAFQVGDYVAVVNPDADVRAGDDVIAMLNRDQRLLVRDTEGSWLLVQFSLRGRRTSGWVRAQDVRLVADSGTALRSTEEYSYYPQYSRPRYQFYYRPSYDYGTWYGAGHYDWPDTSHLHWHGDHFDLHRQSHFDFHPGGYGLHLGGHHHHDGHGHRHHHHHHD